MNNTEINKLIAEIEGECFSIDDGVVVVKDHTGWPSIYTPCTNWIQGGRLIEKHRVDLVSDYESGWHAYAGEFDRFADTPLRAAMLAIIYAHDQAT
ncbi:phage protein NinX family protein [Endozoicomonas acroporae]|uniref:phage protein NinX family protein n=1 Tax=Endozoicomonas acroporae TaxID=1701104 RepID=UPI0013D67440|nr:phage protein NinX family protein [Endozoicomonas acroporae]